MRPNHHPEFLSFGDSLFLYLEREGAPLNIGSLAIFEGEISVADLRKFIASRLPQIPRYMQRVIVPPFNVGLPHWEFATDFDIKRHTREVSLTRGTLPELKNVVASILSPVMDRQNPLWDLTVIRGIKGGRTGLIARIHHCMADGISGIGLLNALMDSQPNVPILKEHKVRVPRSRLNGAGTDVVDSAMRAWFFTLERLLHAGNEVLTLVQRATGLSPNGDSEPAENADNPHGRSADQIVRLATELTEVPERLPFNLVCQGPQRYEWTEAPLDDLKAIRVASKTMVNDVVLTILVSAFRRYSESRGINVRGRSIRIVVPMSTRRHHREINELGNHITFAPVNAPLGIHSPRKLLGIMHERMEFVKTAHVAEFVSFAGTLLGTLPSTLQAMIAPVVSGMPITLCNTICTNVPGPKTPLYLMGHKMLSAYPYVPIGGEMGINCSVLSYNGTVYFGFTGDVHAAPDLKKLPRFVDDSVRELKKSLGIARVRKPRKTSKVVALVEVTQVPAPTPEAEPELLARTAGAGKSSSAA
jgi:WS/DGAT/MGAT family acyltransferase